MIKTLKISFIDSLHRLGEGLPGRPNTGQREKPLGSGTVENQNPGELAAWKAEKISTDWERKNAP